MSAKTAVVSAALLLSATGALAQQPMTVRLTPGDRNPSICSQADAAMSRPHTVTVAGDIATIASSGGINDKAKMASPGLYKTKWSLGGVTYDIEVKASAGAAEVSVAEPKLGCKWSGKSA